MEEVVKVYVESHERLVDCVRSEGKVRAESYGVLVVQDDRDGMGAIRARETLSAMVPFEKTPPREGGAVSVDLPEEKSP